MMNDSKDQAQLRQPFTVVPNKDVLQANREVSKDKRKQLRSNTQERVLRMAEEQIKEIS